MASFCGFEFLLFATAVVGIWRGVLYDCPSSVRHYALCLSRSSVAEASSGLLGKA